MSGRNSESLCGIDVSPHSCLHWVCPTAHERKWRKKAKKKERERREENREKKKLTTTPKLKITHWGGKEPKSNKERKEKKQVRNSVSYFFLQTDAIGQLICQSEHN